MAIYIRSTAVARWALGNRVLLGSSAILLLSSFLEPAHAAKVWIPNPGFEDGLVAPWGTGQYSEGRPVWWNSGGCLSEARIDTQIYHSGTQSLHVHNRSPRGEHVYGTTSQPLSLLAGTRFRITLWARGQDLASDGAVSIVVDPQWEVHPVRLPRGSYDWTMFSGEFSLPDGNAQIRILSADQGEAWIDDLSVETVDDTAQSARNGSLNPVRLSDDQVAEPLDDPLARSLGLTRDSGSLPAWSRGKERDRQQLAQVAPAAQQAILLVGNPQRGFGTAFVISQQHRLLVTNAHVADILYEAGSMLAILNGSTTTWQVERAWYHPGVLREVDGQSGFVVRSPDPRDGRVSSLCPDVAVLQLRHGPELPAEVQLATPDEVRHLFAQPIAMIGFPGHDTRWPEAGRTVQATYHDGVVSRVTDFKMDPAAPVQELQFLQHTAHGFGGFSGSPILLPNGHIVAIHNSGRYANDRGISANISHGVRIDCLWELLAFHGLDDRVAVPVSKPELNLARFTQPDPKLDQFRSVVRLVEQAALLEQQREHAQAVTLCTRAIHQLPNYWRAYDVRMTAHGNYAATYQDRLSARVFQQQVYASMKDGRKLLQLAPSNPVFLVRYAWALANASVVTAQNGRTAEAEAERKQVLAIVDRILAIDSLEVGTRAEALDIYAMTALNLKLARGNFDIEDELAMNAQAIRLRPNVPVYYQNRAAMLSAAGRHEEARRVREQERRLRQLIAQQH